MVVAEPGLRESGSVVVPHPTGGATADPGHRLESIDLLRGIAMVLMALDHARHYFTIVRFSPVDPDATTVAHFFTRWLTHICAPAFVFLAGTGAFLYGMRGRTQRELSWFLLTRGVWLVILELTVMRFGWQFSFDFSYEVGQTLWAIGWSMVVLSVAIHLPVRVTTAIGIVMIVAHNAFDGIRAKAFGDFSWVWRMFHSGGRIHITDDITLSIMYPLIPWIGVMMLGYASGVLFLRERKERNRMLFRIGGIAIAAFVLLRVVNIYGDPHPWVNESGSVGSLISFLNCDKYPPALLFLLMTLGPAVAALPLLGRWRGRVAHALVVFGRVPLFFYILHIYLIHLLAVGAAILTIGEPSTLIGSVKPLELPEGYGFGLPVVYAVWIGVTLGLYPACLWYGGLKQRHRNPFLRYL